MLFYITTYVSIDVQNKTSLGDKMKIEMPFEEINPFVRYVQSIPLTKNLFPQFVRPYDCRMYFVMNGSGYIHFEKEKFLINTGDLILWPSGTIYNVSEIEVSSPPVCITINFDYTQNHSSLDFVFPPEFVPNFDIHKQLESIIFTNTPALNSPLILRNQVVLESYFLELKQEYKTKKNLYQKRVNGIMISILSYVARLSLLKGQYSTDESINLIIDYIHKNYAKKISNVLIGEALGFHPNYISKLMVIHTGVSLHQYLVNYRVTKALYLLETTDIPINDVAVNTGFNDISHFSKMFKQKSGRNPSDYRRGRKMNSITNN